MNMLMLYDIEATMHTPIHFQPLYRIGEGQGSSKMEDNIAEPTAAIYM